MAAAQVQANLLLLKSKRNLSAKRNTTDHALHRFFLWIRWWRVSAGVCLATILTRLIRYMCH